MSDAPDYDVVFWDLGGVVVALESVREGYAAFVSALADEHGFDAAGALDEWKRALGAHFRGREGTEYRTAREGYRTATEALFESRDRRPPPESEWRQLFERCAAEAMRPEPGAVETVRALADAGLYQAVVSDIDTAEARGMLEAFGVADCFADLTTSEEVGYTKPDDRMFETALGKAGVDPARAVMVGDRYEHDIEGAAAHGIHTVAYGADAAGPEADHEVDDLGEVLDVVGVGN